MSRLPEISAALLASGVSAELPVAIVNNATTPQQRVFVSTLAKSAWMPRFWGSARRPFVAIGEMVRLREALSPFAITLTGEG